MSTRLFLLAHAPLASALRDVALHPFADCAGQVDALDVEPGWSLDQVQAYLRQHLHPSQDTLILVDVDGATPANALRALLPLQARWRAVAGVNVPLLWRCLCYRHESLDALVQRALGTAGHGIHALEFSEPKSAR
jgi:mannose PTS system EIIA component